MFEPVNIEPSAGADQNSCSKPILEFSDKPDDAKQSRQTTNYLSATKSIHPESNNLIISKSSNRNNKSDQISVSNSKDHHPHDHTLSSDTINDIKREKIIESNESTSIIDRFSPKIKLINL